MKFRDPFILIGAYLMMLVLVARCAGIPTTSPATQPVYTGYDFAKFVNAAPVGGVCQLPAGEFRIADPISGQVKRSVRILSAVDAAGKSLTTITKMPGNWQTFVIILYADSATAENLIVQSAVTTLGAAGKCGISGVYVCGNHNQVVNCQFRNVDTGIQLHSGVSNVGLTGNCAVGSIYGDGIFLNGMEPTGGVVSNVSINGGNWTFDKLAREHVIRGSDNNNIPPLIQNVTISNVVCSNAFDGKETLAIRDASNVTVEKCTFIGPLPVMIGQGIPVPGAAQADCSNVTFADCTFSGGPITLRYCKNVLIQNAAVYLPANSPYGVMLGASQNVTIEGLTIYAPDPSKVTAPVFNQGGMAAVASGVKVLLTPQTKVIP